MSNKKTKYIIFPDRTYTLEFEDFDGKPFKVDIEGSKIINSLKAQHTLEKFIIDKVSGKSSSAS